MTSSNVEAFFEMVETDDEFAQRLVAVNSDPVAATKIIAEAGFDLDPAEVSEAFLDRFGAQLTEEQLAAISGGRADGVIEGVVIGSIGVAIGLGAAAAAV
jgi:predicted ribosomally synthesized peptide with nif11-like leader